MRLKMQMVLAGLVTLAIPIAGWHSIRQLDDAFEQSRQREQQLRLNNAMASLSNDKRLMSLLNSRDKVSGHGDLYAPRVRYPLFVDGYADDWRELTVPVLNLDAQSSNTDVSASISVRSAVRENRLFLFIDVKDNAVLFHQPPRLVIDFAEGEQPDPYEQLVNGDALEVLVQRPTGSATHGLFRAVAPGALVARVASSTQRRELGNSLGSWVGFWTATPTGMQLEMSLPLPPDGSTLGLAYVDVDSREDKRNRWVGNLNPARMVERHISGVISQGDPQLHRASNELFEALDAWVTPSTRARLFDAQGRLLSDVNRLYTEDESQTAFDPAKSSLWNALVYRFVSSMLRDKKGEYSSAPLYQRIDKLHMPLDVLSSTGPLNKARRYQTDESDFVLGTLGTLNSLGRLNQPDQRGHVGSDSNTPVRGYLLFESNDSRASSYAGSRLAQLLSLLTLVSLAVSGSLLFFATVLSFRIGRLSKQAVGAVSKDGRIGAFVASSSNDEVGELSRTLGSLLGRTQHYTHYLEALSSRLSHELRTPLSVVKTSLENVDKDGLDEQTLQLLSRAGDGADQLGHIIRALVESTRLEQTVQQAQKGPIPVNAFLDGAQARYQQVYPNIEFHIVQTGLSDSQCVHAAPELLQQALDKLVDNAASFTTDNTVTLTCRNIRRKEDNWLSFSVSNPGQLSDSVDPAHVFDPMFSLRTTEDGNLHLGLGLYIVRMVAEAHGGQAAISANSSVVSVSMDMPANSY